MMNAKTVTLTTLSLALASSVAGAETKSWTALKAKLPSASQVVISVDIAGIKKGTKSFQSTVMQFIKEEHDVEEAYTLLKNGCNIDLFDVVTDFSIALDKNGDGVFAVGLANTDESKLLACAQKLAAQQDAKAKVTSKTDKKVTSYFVAGHESDALYVSWLAKDVLLVGTDADKRAGLDAALSGGAATGDLAGYLGKVATGGAAFLAGAIDEDGVKGGYGSVALAKGTFTGTGKLVTKSADVNAKLLAEGQAELAKAMKKADKKAPVAAKFLRTVKMTGAGTEITIAGSVNEADIGTLLPALDKVF